MVYEISKELVKRGHDVWVYASDAKRGDLRERVKEDFEIFDGIKVFHFKHISHQLTKRMGFVVTPGIGISLERECKRFDIIHLHQPRGYQHITVWRLASKKRVPYVIHGHGILGNGDVLHRLYDSIYGKRVLRSASMNIALNEHEVEEFRRLGVPKDKIRVITNGIDLSQFSELPPKGIFKGNFGVGEDEEIILYLGRIHRTKGIEFLLRCFAQLVRNEKQSLRLVIAGQDDGFLAETKLLVDSLGVSDCVLFTGALNEKDKIGAYVDSAVCAYLGRFEPFGLVPLEAAACGTPVIVSKGTHMAEIVDQVGFGFSVEYGDVSGTVNVLKRLLGDESLSRRMSSRATDCVRQFSIEKTVDEIERLYHDILSCN